MQKFTQTHMHAHTTHRSHDILK